MAGSWPQVAHGRFHGVRQGRKVTFGVFSLFQTNLPILNHPKNMHVKNLDFWLFLGGGQHGASLSVGRRLTSAVHPDSSPPKAVRGAQAGLAPPSHPGRSVRVWGWGGPVL